MRNKRKPKRSLFYRFLLSYLLVLVLPIGIFLYWINFRFLGILETEIAHNNLNILSKTVATADASLRSLDSLRNQCLLNRSLRPFPLFQNIRPSMEYIEELSTYRNTYNLIYELGIYNRADGYFYTSQGSYRPALFYDTQYQFSQWDREHFLNDLSQIIEPSVRPAQQVKLLPDSTENSVRLVTFLYPLTFPGSPGPAATLVVFVEESEILGLMRESFAGSQTQGIILDQENQVVSSILQDEDLLAMDFSTLPTGINSTVGSNGRDYLLTSEISSYNGWKYLSFTPAEYTRQQTAAIRRDILIALAMIAALSGLTIYISMQYNFLPFRKLKAYASKILGGDAAKSSDETEAAIHALQYLESQNSSLIASTSTASRAYILRSLLQGKYNKEQFGQQAKGFGIELDQPYFTVACIRPLPAPANEQAYSAMLGRIEEILPAIGVSGYLVEDTPMQQFLVILNLSGSQRRELPALMEAFHSQAAQEFGCDITLSIGGIYNAPSNLPNALLEACYAREYSFIKGIHQVIFYEEARDYKGDIDSYPYRDIEKLKYLLGQGALDQVQTQLDYLLAYIKTAGLPLYAARRLCYDIVNTVFKSINEMELDNAGGRAHSNSYLSLLSNFNTVDDLTVLVHNLCTNICHLVQEEKLNRTSQIDQIKQYIKANYTDCNFSIQAVADNFDMSITNLSQYFKNRTGKTIIDYTTEMRMERAKKLLRTKQYKLGDVAEMVGYVNQSSFIRRFKQYTGVTPGQYSRGEKKTDEL